MTGIGIVIAFLTFIVVVWYLTKRNLQSFWKFFYRLPTTIILIYLLGSYTQFILSNGHFIPVSLSELLQIISPYGYKFHFVGILLGLVISMYIFFRKVKTEENRKIWADILFFGLSLCIIPLGIFLLLGDNFIGQTSHFFGVKSLHSESARNKFDTVSPIGLFLSFGSLIVALYIWIRRRISKKTGYGFLGFALLLLVINIVLIFQQYPRYIVFSLGDIKFDIKQHLSFFVIMFNLYLFNKTKHLQ